MSAAAATELLQQQLIGSDSSALKIGLSVSQRRQRGQGQQRSGQERHPGFSFIAVWLVTDLIRKRRGLLAGPASPHPHVSHRQVWLPVRLLTNRTHLSFALSEWLFLAPSLWTPRLECISSFGGQRI